MIAVLSVPASMIAIWYGPSVPGNARAERRGNWQSVKEPAALVWLVLLS